MELSARGIIARDELLKTILIRKNIIIDPWVIMPNHLHLLIHVRDFHVETPGGASINIKNKTNANINNNETVFNIPTNNENQILNSNDLYETPHRASLQGDQIRSPIIPCHNNHPEFYLRLSTKSKQTIPNVINQFKSKVKHTCNQQNLFFAWQSLYHDIIVKDENQLNTIKNYIINNPLNWQSDKLYN